MKMEFVPREILNMSAWRRFGYKNRNGIKNLKKIHWKREISALTFGNSKGNFGNPYLYPRYFFLDKLSNNETHYKIHIYIYIRFLRHWKESVAKYACVNYLSYQKIDSWHETCNLQLKILFYHFKAYSIHTLGVEKGSILSVSAADCLPCR
jgi:hypothetical protein